MFILILQQSYAAVVVGRRGIRLASGEPREKAKEEAAVKAAEGVSMETNRVKKEEKSGGEKERREVSLESHALLAPLFESLVVVKQHHARNQALSSDSSENESCEKYLGDGERIEDVCRSPGC